MRGLVMEVREETLVVLTPQGKYIRMKNPGASAIGDFVPCEGAVVWPQWLPHIHWVPRKAMALAASFMLMCTAGLGAYGYSQPFGVVSIDINPSMTLTYNWFEQVIAVEALNTDAEKLLPGLEDLKNKPISEAVNAVVAAASEAGYLEPELANVVFISVSDKNNRDRTTEVLKDIGQDLEKSTGKSEAVLFKGTEETYRHVKKFHETPTKELIESSLKNNSGNGSQTQSGKPLANILREQEETRMKNADTNRPENSGHQEKTDKEKPSKGPDIKNHDKNPGNDSERPAVKPDDQDHGNTGKDDTQKKDDKNREKQELKPWDPKGSKDGNKSDH